MEALKQWAFSICCAMVACGIMQILMPKSSLERMFKLVVSVFFLCCLLSPFLLRSAALGLELREYPQNDIEERASRLESVVERQWNGAAAGGLEKIVRGKLAEMGINDDTTTINIITNGQITNEPPIVEITLDSAYRERHNVLRGALMDELGLEVRLGYVEPGEREGG